MMKIIEKIKAKQANPAGAEPITLAFIGDSVTQGCYELYKTGERSFMAEFRVEQTYHNKLRHILELCYPRVPFNMIYAGINGNSTGSGLQRLDRDVIAFNPDLTVVCFGLNDCVSGMDNLENYKNNLRQIFQKLKEAGGEVIFMTPNLMANAVSPEITDEYTKEVYTNSIGHFPDFMAYMDGAREVAKEMDVHLCDCAHKWETMMNNGVDYIRLLSNRINHPTEEMHWLFAVSLFELIQGM